MPKKASDTLYQLINSMTGAEKRYFKVFARQHTLGDENKYVVLFDAIEAQTRKGIYDERAMVECNDILKDVQLPNLKKYLKDLLLKSLSLFNQGKHLDSEVRTLLNHVQILYEKQLYGEAEVILKKARKLAGNGERLLLLLEVIDVELKLIHVQQDINRLREIRPALEREEQKILEKVSNEQQMRHLMLKGFIYTSEHVNIYSPGQMSSLENLLSDTLLQDERMVQTWRGKTWLYQLHMHYYVRLGNPNKVLEYARKTYDLVKKHREVLKYEPKVYTYALFNLIFASAKNKSYNEAIRLIQEVRKIQSAAIIKQSPEFEISVGLECLKAEVYTYIRMHQIDLAEDAAERAMAFYDKHQGNVSFRYFSGILENVAYHHFMQGAYDRALDIVRIFDRHPRKDQVPDYYFSAKLISILIHFKYGNYQLVDSLVNSLQRFMKSNARFTKGQALIFKMMKKLTSLKQHGNHKTILQETLDELRPLSNHLEERELFDHFDIIGWIEAELVDKPFKQLWAQRNV